MTFGKKSCRNDTHSPKYEIDLDVAPLITEIRIYADEKGRFHIPDGYRSDVVYGPNVKSMAVALYSEGVMSNDRIASFLNAAGGSVLGLSEGSVYHFCRTFSRHFPERSFSSTSALVRVAPLRPFCPPARRPVFSLLL